MGLSASRLTLYAVLSSLEDDLRKGIVAHLEGTKTSDNLLSPEISEKCRERMRSELGGEISDASLLELLEYADFGDLLQVLNRNSAQLPTGFQDILKRFNVRLEKLIPVRNRVAHSRPLLFDDLAVAVDLGNELVETRRDVFPGLVETLQRLEAEPSFVLGLEIPSYDDDKMAGKHNLPTPDFDETGFIGRETQAEQLVGLTLGAFPVITIVGTGGVGKTSLALKVAYDILDIKSSPFDAIVWTSSKTSQITVSDVIAIDGAIKDSLGVFKSMANQLAGVSQEDPIEEILEYLREFRILLIMDNLETVLDERIRQFLRRLPTGSKILITSRIGIGAYEYPFKLEPMNQGEAVQLLRALSKCRGVPSLGHMQNQQLAKYCSKLNNSPGYIKWFVAAVQAGKRPEEVFAKPEKFLEFCMSNVYDYLSNESRRTLMAMQSLPGRHSQAELAFLLEFDDPAFLHRALQQLMTTNMVRMISVPTGASFESRYEIDDMARDYLTNHHPLAQDDVKKFSKRKQQIKAAGDLLRSGMNTNRYRIRHLRMRSASDTIVAKYLSDALMFVKGKRLQEARRSVDKAKELTPEYFEVHRVDAFVRANSGDISGANTAYEAAVELDPTWPPLRLWYGGFLMRLDDLDGALEQFREGLKHDPQSYELKVEMARVSLYLKDFSGAEDQLSSLLDEKNLSVWHKKKIYDLYLQTRYRWAEERLDEHDPLGALKLLEELKLAYERCPSYLRDAIMIEHIGHAVKTGARLCAALRQQRTEHQKAREITCWLLRTTGHVGHVIRISREDDQATLELSDKRQVLVNRGAFLLNEDWRNLDDSIRVLFQFARGEESKVCNAFIEIVS
jgi:Tfp pilus assembly protein PilF